MIRLTLLAFVACMLFATIARPAEAASAYFYVGTMGPARGIYGVSLDLNTGKLSTPRLIADVGGPGFLAFDAAHGRLFACVDGPDGAAAGFKVNASSHALTAINTAPAGGSGTTHICLTADGKGLMAANYNAGTVALLPIDADGNLGAAVIDQHSGSGPDKTRQTAPHPHGVFLDPTGQFVLCCDLGTDKIYIYAADGAAKTLKLKSTFSMPRGSGPRHLTFSTGGHFCYVVNELTSTVTVLKWDATLAKLTSLQTVDLLPNGFDTPHRGCEVAVHSGEKFLFAADRGPDLLTTLQVDGKTGKLTAATTAPTGGDEARHFAIAPGGKFLVLANMKSDGIVVFKIDTTTGRLTPVDTADVRSPSCICFVP